MENHIFFLGLLRLVYIFSVQRYNIYATFQNFFACFLLIWNIMRNFVGSKKNKNQ